MTTVKKISLGILAVAFFVALAPAFGNVAAAQTTRSATTVGAMNITETSATLTGNSTFPPTREWFEVGISASLGYSVSASNGVGQFTGLLPGHTYYYRYVAQDANGTCLGEIKSFTTPGSQCVAPVATTGGVSNVTGTSATLSGSSSGSITRSWFEVGTSASLGYSVADSGGTGQFTNLQPGTTYYYRYVAQNNCETSYGDTRSFTTPSAPACTAPVPTTGSVSNLTGTSAVIHGSYSGTVTRTWFEVGTSQNLGYSIADNGGSGQFTNLQPGTTYYYRYVAQNSCGTNYGSTQSFTTPSAPVCTPPSATTLSATGVTHIYAQLNGSTSGNPTAVWFEWGTTTALGQTVNASGNSAALTGLQPGTTYYFRIVAQNACGTDRGQILSFRTDDYNPGPPNPPACTPVATASTGSATNVTQSSATLTGTASGNSIWFEYGSTQSLGQAVNASGGSANISGLQPNTTYYFRIVAQTQCGTVQGQIVPFTTPGPAQCTPVATATTNSATNVTQSSATLNGTASGNSVWFEYGSTQSLGQTVNASGGSVNIAGLQPNTTYYFRIVAQTQCGTVQGQILQFTTSGGGGTCTPIATATTNSATNVSQNSATLNGTASGSSMWFEYGTTQSLGQTVNAYGGSANIYNLQPNTTYFYRIVAQTQCGTVQGQILQFTTSGGGTGYCQIPTVTITSATNVANNSATLNAYINPNGYATTYWFQYGSTNSYGYTTPTQGPIYSAQNVSSYVYSLNQNATYYFNVVAQNQCGTSYGQNTLTFTTTGGPTPPVNPQGPTAITDPATGIGRTSALLNGRVNANGNITTGWFEWGQSTALGNTTNQQSIGSGYNLANLSYPVSGLQPATTYYFRVVGQNQYGTAYGQILSFTTGTGGTITTGNPPIYNYRPPVIVTTVSGGIAGGSCLVLTPGIQPSNPIPGGEFTYSITYRNDCPFDLQNASLRNYLPNEVDFSATSYPFVTRDLNVITYNLGMVPRGFQNTILVKGLVKPTVRPGDNLIYKSDLAFTDPRGQFQSVSAFLTATAAAVATAGFIGTASILDTLMSFLSSGWFWFLLFLLLLAMFILWLATRNRAADLEHE